MELFLESAAADTIDSMETASTSSHPDGRRLTLEDLSAILQRAQKNLNDSLRHFEAAPPGLQREFVDLKLQACIFQYDVCAEMVNVVRTSPIGFAECVSLKGLVLRLFEYHLALDENIIPRLAALAAARGIAVEAQALRALRGKWRQEFKQLQAWHGVRNKAAGHYDKDLALQVELLKTLTTDGVMSVAGAFLLFNMELLQMLRDAGRAL